MKFVLLALGIVALTACQSSPGANSPSQAAFANARPATADEEARALAAADRLQAKAGMRTLETLDPTGASRAGSYYRDRYDPDMAEVMSAAPAMQASAEKRIEEACANPEMARQLAKECAQWPALRAQRDALRSQAQRQGY